LPGNATSKDVSFTTEILIISVARIVVGVEMTEIFELLEDVDLLAPSMEGKPPRDTALAFAGGAPGQRLVGNFLRGLKRAALLAFVLVNRHVNSSA